MHVCNSNESPAGIFDLLAARNLGGSAAPLYEGERLVRYLVTLIPSVLMVAGAFLILGVAFLVMRRGRNSDRESPLTRNLIRSPGYSLRKKIETLDQEIMFLFLVSVTIPLYFYASHLSQSYLGGAPESVGRIAVSVVVCIGILAFVVRRLVPMFNDRKNTLLGLEGELATGEELNQLMLDGCCVFHDVPFPYGNIDHVVISQSGVYAVNSKMLRKKRGTEGGVEVIVDHERGIVHFPDWDYFIPTKEFDTERNWLSGFLTSAVGQPVSAESILALPGWFVKKRVGRGSVYVINPYKPKRFFVHNRQIHTPDQIQRIAHHLEQLCRDVKPSFREERERWEAD